MAEKKPKLVKARWVGTFEAQMPDLTVLIPNETVVEISQHEAEVSDNWQIVGKKKAPAKAKTSTPKATEPKDSTPPADSGSGD